jgi:hypothetical protein
LAVVGIAFISNVLICIIGLTVQVEQGELPEIILVINNSLMYSSVVFISKRASGVKEVLLPRPTLPVVVVSILELVGFQYVCAFNWLNGAIASISPVAAIAAFLNNALLFSCLTKNGG